MTTANHQDRELAACDIVDLVRERNDQIRHAFANVLAAEGSVKATLFDELVTILAGREAVAQELIRPLVGPQGPVTSAVHTRPVKQAEVISGLSLLSGMDVKGDTFDLELIGVARTVTLHIAAKERHDLPLLRRSLPTEELHALAEVLLSAETITKTRATVVESEITPPGTL